MMLLGMWYVYILHSKKLNKFYTGSTGNLKERLDLHNSQGSPYTSVGIPWVLVYYEAFLEKRDAIAEELFLKTGKGRERRSFLLKNLINKIQS
jgi:putative endonuclease